MKNNQFTATWADLEIDYSDWQTDPATFCKRVANRAKEIAAELDRPNSIMSNEEQFKSKALNNPEAKKEAQEFVDRIMDEMSELSPEVIANLMVLFPEVTKTAHTVIRNMAMRKNKQMGKKRLHAMYMSMRSNYETFTNYLKLFEADLPSMPIIPPKSGNYSSDVISLGIKEFIFKLNEEEYYNYYAVARILGIKIEHYMDLVDYFNANPIVTIDGKEVKLSLEDISR